MSSKLPSHLMINRYGVYYLRISIQGKERRKSLRTRDPHTARAASHRYSLALHTMSSQIDPFKDFNATMAMVEKVVIKSRAEAKIKALQQQFDEAEAFNQLLSQNPHLKQEAPTITPIIATTHLNNLIPITIEAACDKYLNSREGQVTIGSNRTWKSCHNKLKKVFKGRQISTITKDEITHIIVNPIGGKSKDTITKDAEEWSRVFDYMIKCDHLSKNPVIKPKFTRAQTARLRAEHGKERLPHEDDDILKLFSTKHLNALLRPEDIWLPFLSLSCGARLESLARLRVNDIKAGTITLLAETDKDGRARVIPIHPLLTKAGFLIYISEIKALFGEESYIFTEMNEVEGRRSHYFSKSFGLKRKKLGIAKGKDFHAYRTTVVSRLDKDEVNGRVRRLFVGHKVGEVLDIEDTHYNKGAYTPEELADRIFASLDYDEIEWTYTPNSAIKLIEAIKLKRNKTKLQNDHKVTIKNEKDKPINKAKLASSKQRRLEKQKLFEDSKNKI